MAIRRSERYTVPDKLYSFPEPGVYRDAFHDLPLFQRVYLLFRTWFGNANIARVIKDHELEEIKRRVGSSEAAIVDPTIPALLDGFHTRVRAVAKNITALKPVLLEVRGTVAGPFLRETLERLDPELYSSIDATCLIPEDLMRNPATTAEDARKAVLEYLHQSLEINAKTIREHLNPVWNSMEALALLSTVDFDTLIPANVKQGVRVPIRVVKDQLVQLTCTLNLCMRFHRPDAIKGACEFVTHRMGKRFTAQNAIWNAIDAVDAAIPLIDLVRLAMDEPRLELAQIGTNAGWWNRFSAAWQERIDVQSPLLRHRSIVVEDLLRNSFEVTESTASWIPPSLFQRTVGALKRLGLAQRFRDTRTMVGALAREQGLMPAGDRARILESHVELDNAYTRLEELTGIGEARGVIGDELRRVKQSDGAESIAGVHKMNVYSKHRPEIQVVVGQTIEALTSIASHFNRNRGHVRRALKTGTVRIDTGNDDIPPVEVLELIVDGYHRLALGLRGLFSLEYELTDSKRAEKKSATSESSDEADDDLEDLENEAGPGPTRPGSATTNNEGTVNDGGPTIGGPS